MSDGLKKIADKWII